MSNQTTTPLSHACLPDKDKGMGGKKSLVPLLSSMGHGANDIYWFILPLVLPLMLEQFRMAYTGAGGILSAYLLVIAFFSFFWGKMADRVSRPVLIGAGFFAASFCLLGAGLVQNVALFVVFLLLSAVGVGVYHPVIYALLHESIVSGRGRAFGRFEFWGLLTIVIMVVAVGTLLDTIGWRQVILVATLPGFMVGALFLLLRSRLESGKGRRAPAAEAGRAVEDKVSATDSTVSEAVDGAVGAGAGSQHAPRDNRSHAPKSATFVLLCVSNMSVFLTLMAVMNFMPTFFVRATGLSPTLASYVTALYFVGGLFTAPLAGRLVDRVNPLIVYTAATLLLAPLVFLISQPLPGWLLPMLLVLLGGCSGAIMPSRNMVFSRYSATMGSGQVFGILMGLSTVTNSLSPIAYGFLADRSSLQVSMLFFALPALLGAAIAVSIAHAARRSRSS